MGAEAELSAISTSSSIQTRSWKRTCMRAMLR